YEFVRDGVHIRTGGVQDALDHPDKDDVIRGIDPEPGAGGAAPGERALSYGVADQPRVRVDAEIEPESETRAHAEEADAELAAVHDRGGEAIGAHQGDGRGREDAGAVELTAIEQHLAEAEIIAGGGDQTAAARGHSGLFGVIQSHSA